MIPQYLITSLSLFYPLKRSKTYLVEVDMNNGLFYPLNRSKTYLVEVDMNNGLFYPLNGSKNYLVEIDMNNGLFYPLNGSKTYLVEVDMNQGTLHLHSSHIPVIFQRGDIRGHACPHGYGNQSHVAGVCP